MLSVRLDLLPISNLQISIVGAKSSKLSNFCPSVKKWLNSITMPYSSIWVQGYARFPKWSPRSQVITISRKSRQLGLPRKMQFLKEARFKMLSPLVRLWRRNKSVGGLSFWFWVPIGLTSCMQNDASLNWHLHSFLWKKQVWANNIKHWHIIYHWKWFVATIKNSRSLPENKTLFGTDHC